MTWSMVMDGYSLVRKHRQGKKESVVLRIKVLHIEVQ